MIPFLEYRSCLTRCRIPNENFEYLPISCRIWPIEPISMDPKPIWWLTVLFFRSAGLRAKDLRFQIRNFSKIWKRSRCLKKLTKYEYLSTKLHLPDNGKTADLRPPVLPKCWKSAQKDPYETEDGGIAPSFDKAVPSCPKGTPKDWVFKSTLNPLRWGASTSKNYGHLNTPLGESKNSLIQPLSMQETNPSKWLLPLT